MHIVLGVLKKVQVIFTEIMCNIFSLNCFYNHMFSQNRAYGADSINWYCLTCGDQVFWLGKGYLNLFILDLKRFTIFCHNWPSRWFPALIMRISRLIQTIQPDPQILTSVHEGDSFSKNNNNNNNNKKLLYLLGEPILKINSNFTNMSCKAVFLYIMSISDENIINLRASLTGSHEYTWLRTTLCHT